VLVEVEEVEEVEEVDVDEAGVEEVPMDEECVEEACIEAIPNAMPPTISTITEIVRTATSTSPGAFLSFLLMFSIWGLIYRY
jgi:DNA-binding protein YbaB